MDDQHDDHCWVFFHGASRKIEGMAGVGWIRTMTRTGAYAILDLSRVRWDDYVASWEEMQDEEFPGWR